MAASRLSTGGNERDGRTGAEGDQPQSDPTGVNALGVPPAAGEVRDQRQCARPDESGVDDATEFAEWPRYRIEERKLQLERVRGEREANPAAFDPNLSDGDYLPLQLQTSAEKERFFAEIRAEIAAEEAGLIPPADLGQFRDEGADPLGIGWRWAMPDAQPESGRPESVQLREESPRGRRPKQ